MPDKEIFLHGVHRNVFSRASVLLQRGSESSSDEGGFGFAAVNPAASPALHHFSQLTHRVCL